jgi:hypothetical protein
MPTTARPTIASLLRRKRRQMSPSWLRDFCLASVLSGSGSGSSCADWT